jgi:lipopolysaccharide export system permease protein
MIFDRAARREFVQAAAGIAVALLAILLSTQLIRLLKDAAGGRIAPEAVGSLLGFAALGYLPVVLTLTLFVTVVMTLSRMYRDSEMVVWFSCGQPLTAWIRPVLRFALPVVLAIAVLAGFLSPWANYKTAEYKERLAARSDISQVSPGTFREVKRGQRVFFVEAMAEDATKVGNVFVASMQDGRLGVVMSNQGYQEFAPNGDRFIVLEHGRRYEVEPGTPEFRVMDFERYRLRTEDGEAKPAERSPNRLPLTELIRDSGNPARGELLWRIGVPVAAMVLALLAIPLSYVNPRAGRSANMLIAIVIYAIYNNLLAVSQSWVSQGRISFAVGVWAIHALMCLPLVVMLYHRMVVRPFWRRRRG